VSSVEAFINYDVVINTTSVGMAPDIEQTPVEISSLNPDAIVCDIVYKPHKTKLIREALANGHKVIYGIEMLLEQALLAQELWNGLTYEVISKNRNELMTEFEALNK
jgi:shikimate dehydrogenase